MHAYHAAVIRAIRCEESGFKRDEGCGCACANRWLIRDAGIGIEPARDVQRENACATRVGARDPFRGYTLDRAGETDAEQAVDDQAPIIAIRPAGRGRSAGIDPCLVSCTGIGRQLRRIAVKSHRHVEEPALQSARDNERVAAVVARACENQNARSTSGEQVAGGAGGGESGTVHERVCCRGAFDRAQLRDATDRIETHTSIIGYGIF